MDVTMPPDPWQKVRTYHDIPADEVISGLQKSLRRGAAETALLLGYEMFLTSEALEQKLWARLQVIPVEDVGLGEPMLPVLIETLFQQHLRVAWPSPERFLFAAHAIRLIARAPKDRTSDDMAGFARLELVARNRTPEVPDYAIDMHTRRGIEMGRGYDHFLTEASHVENELPERDTSFRDRLQAAIAAGELR
ncbi:AAA family ATPase [Pseudooceanicola sp. CBS1P-1]|uniref:AAA family ATPase n=1 Tax=Pseudooceanicola albus TaxID=2692189 RepID=A0A6L7G0B1_9RHOB|nr:MULTISPECIES: AAA family ATPase [Pseudooceanicola]MBT9382419.1 AAA family ATPase [Pseudooceanicola endophyticus]MXN16960.1 AAA family ATPase [Pseudooceanicola albus]